MGSFSRGNEVKNLFTNIRRKIILVISGIVLTFLCSLTLGNAPYVFAGYGLSAFSLFLIGIIYPKKEAFISFFLGIILATSLLLYTASIFLLVGIAFIIVRTLQLILLIYFKERIGILASSLLVAIFGSFMATILGIAYYGEGALSTALSFYDIIYLFPAYLAYKYIISKNVLGFVASILISFILFLSLSTFLILYSLILSLILIFLCLFHTSNISKKYDNKNINISKIVFTLIIIILILSYILFFIHPSSSYVLRTTYYALYEDSFSKTQWYQKYYSKECLTGNLAGDWTEEGGVWGPQRLRVIHTCVTVTGVIMGIFPSEGPASDGDFSLDLKVDPEYEYLLSLGSYWFRSGYLHVEVIPKDQPTVLAGLNLKAGMKVKVTGVWVLDTDHGWWSEIHPAWSIEILS